MKKFIVLFVFCTVVLCDFIFFDYNISDLKDLKVDTTELYKKIEGGIESDLPFLFESTGFYVRNCKEYFSYKPIPKNAFEKDVIRDIDKKCNLLKYLRNAKISSDSFIDYISLRDFNSWDKELFFKYTCNKTMDYSKIIDNYDNVGELVKADILDIKVVEPTKILVHNKFLNKKFQIKDLFRANFDDNGKIKDVLLEISVADDTDNYVECVNYVVFSRKDKKSILKEEKIPFRKTVLKN